MNLVVAHMKRLRFLLLVLPVLLAGAERPAFAQAAYALSFDGTTDYVTLGQTSAMVGASWRTTKAVSVWVRPTGSAVCTSADPGSCDNVVGDRPRTWGISRGTLGGSDRLWVWNYDGTVDRIGLEYTPGEWILVTLVHAGGELRAYRNGLLIETIASGATPELGAQSILHVGGIINNATRNWTFEGDIDEVSVWNAAPADEYIGGNFYGSLAGNEPGLVAYYRMSDGAGTSLTDDSGHGWTGTLRDGATGVPANGPIAWISPGVFSSSAPPSNERPVADAQSIATIEDGSAAIALSGADPDGDPITYRIVSLPAHGALSGVAPNVLYTPAPDYNGADTFSFVVNDGRIDSLPATISLTVAAVDDAPVAGDDSVTTEADTPIVINVLSNDADVDGDAIAISAVADPAHGMATDDGTRITYVPDPEFVGTDTFTYTIVAAGVTATADVTVTVAPPGDGPGFALGFDGVSDYVSLAETVYIMGAEWATTKTVDLWVKPTGTPSCTAPTPANCDAIVSDRPRWWGISRGSFDGTDRIWVWNWDSNGLDTVAIDVTPNEWLHVAMVHGNGMLTAYKNGVLVGSVPSGATQQPFTGAMPILHLGGVINTTTKNWTFSGELDEVRIWSTARTAQELQQFLTQPLQGTEPGLAAYYRMTDGAGAFLTDDSGRGWFGKLTDGGQGVPADGAIIWLQSGAFALP
jgi:hypothetical protein